MKLSLEQGKKLVKLARTVIVDEYKGEPPEEFEEPRGVFVTIYSYPEGKLRGCIGFPYPTHPLWMSVTEAARAAAFGDPRFPPISKGERFIIEISVLTRPKEIKARKPEAYAKKITIGEDGLIVQKDDHSGLLLPQVFSEWGADELKALDMTCEKAGLPKEEWKKGDCKISKFQAQLFREKKPGGEVEEHLLGK